MGGSFCSAAKMPDGNLLDDIRYFSESIYVIPSGGGGEGHVTQFHHTEAWEEVESHTI